MFVIKQGDTLPNINFQIFQADGVTPLDLSAAQSISIAIRGANGGPLLFKKACLITNAAQGLGVYSWVAGDTNTVGGFEYEFEILWNTGDTQTVPVDGYFTLTIIDDIA